MKKFILLCLFTAITNIVQAQVSIQIADSETKGNIEFASILLPDYQKSFVANEKGVFVIDTEKYQLPLKVVAEQFGFESKEITLQNNQPYNVFLNPTSELLREVVIPPANAKIKERTFGRTNEGWGLLKGEFHGYSEKDKDTGFKFGMIINTNKKLKKLKKIHWYITGVDFKKAIYGIELYEVENGNPTKRIPHEDIRFTITNKNTGWNVVNVEDLDIYIEGSKKIAVLLKTLNVELSNASEANYLVTNVSAATSNLIIFTDSEFKDWTRLPFNFPFYITVDSYE